MNKLAAFYTALLFVAVIVGSVVFSPFIVFKCVAFIICGGLAAVLVYAAIADFLEVWK